MNQSLPRSDQAPSRCSMLTARADVPRQVYEWFLTEPGSLPVLLNKGGMAAWRPIRVRLPTAREHHGVSHLQGD